MNVKQSIVLFLCVFTTPILLAQERQSDQGDAFAGEDAAPATQPAEAPAFFQLDYSGDLWTSPALTGDWGGLRNDLAQKGISFNVEVLQFAMGNAHGGRDTSEAFRYAGSADYILQLDTGRMGLWPGGFAKIRGETVFGKSINDKVGSISPTNFDALFPEPDDCGLTTLTEVYFMQFLSEKLYVLAGKIDFTRLPGGNAFTGDAYNQFLNTALWQDPTTFALIPYTALAAGVGMMPTKWFDVATFVIDSHGRPTRTGFDTAFHSPNGMTLLQAFAFHIKPFGLPGTQRFNFAWSSRDRIDLDDTGRLLLSGAAAPSFERLNLPKNLLTPGRQLPKVRGIATRFLLSRLLEPSPRPDDWAFWYDFDQYLYVEAEDPTQGVGVFGRFGWSPGDSNPIEACYTFGIGGKGILPERDHDRFGIGYYHINFNDGLPALSGIHSEQGVELFYNIEVTPWLHITPDLQVIMNPGGGFQDRDVALVYGLRAQMSF